MTDIKRGDFLVSQIKQLSDRNLQKMLRDGGIEDLNSPQGRILSVLWQEDSLTISELSNRTSLAKTSLTTMLDRLVERNYINRVFDNLDRRQVKITLTDKAKALRGDYDRISEDMNELLYKGFAKEEVSQLESWLEKVRINLECGLK